MEIAQVQQQRDAWFSRRKRLVWAATRRFRPLGPLDRVHVDDHPYPHYAYGVLVSCMMAKMLGHDCVTVIEFGVAGGNGLVALERASAEIGGALGVQVDVLGFDTGEGMPPSDDVRDMVYWFRPAAYRMDVPKLQQRLERARLVIGRVEDTIGEATNSLGGPIGFIAVDTDYYSAAAASLRVFDAGNETRLPRVLVYADDVFGHYDMNIMCTEVGEERAFAEFNASRRDMVISAIRGLRQKRPYPALWNDKMYALHDFAHPDYNTPINPGAGKEAEELLSLRSRLL